MRHVHLKYGSSEIKQSLPTGVELLSHSEPSITFNPKSFIQNIQSYLQKQKTEIRNAGIVVSDKTRLCEYPLLLPLVTTALRDHGLMEDNIIFYIAYGTHSVQTEEECLTSYGESYKRFRFVHHRSREENGLISVGTTSRGTEVKVLKEIFEHDLFITIGAISHHYIAGFGGGRKLLVPGLAGYDTILQNHKIFLDFEKKELRKGCRSGNLDTNPMALDLEEINTKMPARLEIHAIINSQKEVCEVHFGTGYDDFRMVCERYDQFFRAKKEKQYDMVVASAGGYPKDINFIQAHKSIHNAASFVRDNGVLIIFAECRDGIGNQTFLNVFFKRGEWDQIFKQMAVKYENNGGTALAMVNKARRIRIHFVTSFDQETCQLMGALKTSPEQASELIAMEKGSMACIKNASLLYR